MRRVAGPATWTWPTRVVRTSPRTCRAVERPTSTRAGRTPAPLRTTPPSVVVRMPTRRAASATALTSSVTTTDAADDTEDGRDGNSRSEVRGDDEERRGSDENVRGSEEDGQASDEERQKTAEEFAREHDPEKHDVAAGEEFRRRATGRPTTPAVRRSGTPRVTSSRDRLRSSPSQPVRVKPLRVRSRSESSRSESSPRSAGPDRASPASGHGRRRTAHVLAGRDPRRWLRRRLGRADRRRGRPARAPRQGVGGHQDVRRARPREVRRGRAARVVRRRARGPASGLPSRRLTRGRPFRSEAATRAPTHHRRDPRLGEWVASTCPRSGFPAYRGCARSAGTSRHR